MCVCHWNRRKHIINDIFITDSQRERDKIVKMTKTLNDPSVFTLRVWETLSTICQEIFLRATQMIYIVAKSRLRRDENGSTLPFWDILVIKTLLLNLILMLVLINSPTSASDRIQKWSEGRTEAKGKTFPQDEFWVTFGLRVIENAASFAQCNVMMRWWPPL